MHCISLFICLFITIIVYLLCFLHSLLIIIIVFIRFVYLFIFHLIIVFFLYIFYSYITLLFIIIILFCIILTTLIVLYCTSKYYFCCLRDLSLCTCARGCDAGQSGQDVSTAAAPIIVYLVVALEYSNYYSISMDSPANNLPGPRRKQPRIGDFFNTYKLV